MKIRFLAVTLGLISLVQTVMVAQEGFHLGISGSFSSVWIVSQNNYETLFDCPDPLIQSAELAYDLTLGYTAGGMLGYQFREQHGFVVSMQYAKFGQDYRDGFTTSLCPEFTDVRRSLDLRYFQIPVQYKLTGTGGATIKPYGLFGVQFGFLGTSEEEVLIGGIEKENFQVAATEKFRNFDFGLALEGGADIFLTDDLFFSAGLSTYFGLIDINGMAVRDFISQNDETYKASRNYKAGLHLGLHYLVRSHRRRAAW